MKHTKNHDKAPHRGPKLVFVRFEFNHPTATRVYVAGCFNHWQPEAKPLHSIGNGNWVKETMLEPGTYEYRFVVDGEWTTDPLAEHCVPNAFGSRNSVLKVFGPEMASLRS